MRPKKLNDIIKSYNWLSVELTLLRLYPYQEAMIEEYQSVFEKLKFLKPENYNMSIVLTKNECDFDGDNDGKTYVDVSGRIEEDLDSITNSYAIEFVEWRKWLGMDIAPETIKNFTELEIITHCLYEMTFIGYNEEEIKEQFDEINESIEDNKSMTEEEKKETTVTFEELKELLNKKGSS